MILLLSFCAGQTNVTKSILSKRKLIYLKNTMYFYNRLKFVDILNVFYPPISR